MSIQDSPRCSEQAAGLPLVGSAPSTGRWWLVESPGPWGARPIRDATEAWLRAWSTWDSHTARAVLVRPHGRTGVRSHRRIWTFAPGTDHVLGREIPWDDDPRIEDPGVAPTAPEWTASADYPRMLICTNGRRDRCCAEKGRSLLDDLRPLPTDDQEMGRVWECTHLGGHRFAPTGLVIPQGFVLGRLTTATVIGVLADDILDLDRLRGRSDLGPAEQVADWVFRIEMQTKSMDVRPDITLVHDSTHADKNARRTMEVRHAGVTRQISVHRVELPAIPASCDGDPQPAAVWQLTP